MRHLFGALLAAQSAELRLVGPGAGPWCQLLERVSRSLRPQVAYIVRSLLLRICEHPDEMILDQLSPAGETSRRLLEFAWHQTRRDGWLAIHALQCACRTFASDPAASTALIRLCVEPRHFSQFGFEEMPWLAREIKWLIRTNPTLCAEIYRVAFAFPETSTEPTSMGSGRILSLISNRKQDYDMALYELANEFPGFLEHSPENATRALIAVIEAYIGQRHSSESGELGERIFDFDGREAHLVPDYSGIWDEGDTYRHDEPIKMLDAFQNYLNRLAELPERLDQLHGLLAFLISETRHAVLWRRILQVAACCPGTLGRDVLPLAWSIPILTCYDTTIPAGNFLKAVFPASSRSERERIEQAILRIPEEMSEDRALGEHIQNRLLGCLSDSELVTEEARHVLERLRTQGAIPSNEPPVRFARWSAPYGEEDYLQDQGVPAGAKANQNILKLERPIKEFIDKYLNSIPTLEEFSTILASLQPLYDALRRADADGVHPKQRDHAWGVLADACTRFAYSDKFSCEEAVGSFMKTVFLNASHNAEPVYDFAHAAQFDEHISWGPAARTEAARGLIGLARRPGCATPEVLEALERLSNDTVPEVRFQIAIDLTSLYRTAPELMWRLIERICREEASRGVLHGILRGTLRPLSGPHSDRVIDMTKLIFNRVREGPGTKTVRELCTVIFANLYLWRNKVQCGEVVLNIAANPIDYPDEGLHLLAYLREPLTHGPTHPSDPEQDAVRHRALDLLERLLHSSCDALREIERSHPEVLFNDWPSEDQKRAESLAHLIYYVGSTVYFASGAHVVKEEQRTAEARPPTHEQAERFYREAHPILEELADFGSPNVTHHLLQTLESFIRFDPRGVFLTISRVICAGQQGGYQYESLAADLIVRIIERYIAEYRPLFREDADCRHCLIEILDIFVQAEWPSARRLTYRMSEIFR
jgi:hypothetical protein